jgi:hypothetical protein
LFKLVSDKGDSGKAYLKFYMDQSTKHLVIIPTLLPAQPWQFVVPAALDDAGLALDVQPLVIDIH